MINRVAFRVDSGTVIGAGHLTRCLTLAGALAQHGVTSHFVGRDHAGHLLDLARAAGHETIVLKATTTAASDPGTWLGAEPDADANATLHALRDLGPIDWLILDHYGVDATWHDLVHRAGARTMAIDDLANRPLRIDVLLDHNFGAKDKPYAHVAPGAQKLLGPAYALLDPRLQHARAHARATAPRPEGDSRVLISLGGSDPDDTTSWVLTTLSDDLALTSAIDVVIGRSHPAPHAVHDACKALPHATLHVQTSDMPGLLADADLAIGAGGVSTLERACIGIPTVAVSLAPNQLPALRALDRAGLLVHVEGYRDEPAKVRQAYHALIADHERRRRMSTACRRAVDGRGLERVVDALIGATHSHPQRRTGGNDA